MNVIQMLRRVALDLYTRITREEYIEYRGSLLPPDRLRRCHAAYRDDEYFLKSSEVEAQRLRSRLGFNPHSTVLDIGCGAGRLPIGIIRLIGDVEYVGLDVAKDCIEWCNRFISRMHPSFAFVHTDVYSERYNPSGRPIDANFRLPFPDDFFDNVYMYGVATNMTERHTRVYLREIHRLLKPQGRAFLSAFVEEEVPKVTENPTGYLDRELSGPLNVVLYKRDYFLSTLKESRLNVDAMERMSMEFHDGQTAFYLSK